MDYLANTAINRNLVTDYVVMREHDQHFQDLADKVEEFCSNFNKAYPVLASLWHEKVFDIMMTISESNRTDQLSTVFFEAHYHLTKAVGDKGRLTVGDLNSALNEIEVSLMSFSGERKFNRVNCAFMEKEERNKILSDVCDFFNDSSLPVFSKERLVRDKLNNLMFFNAYNPDTVMIAFEILFDLMLVDAGLFLMACVSRCATMNYPSVKDGSMPYDINTNGFSDIQSILSSIEEDNNALLQQLEARYYNNDFQCDSLIISLNDLMDLQEANHKEVSLSHLFTGSLPNSHLAEHLIAKCDHEKDYLSQSLLNEVVLAFLNLLAKLRRIGSRVITSSQSKDDLCNPYPFTHHGATWASRYLSDMGLS